ncbi:MAG: MotA/TolQ/ExbB proton channel family protein [Deltaproteobacteria bacterium]|jgi:biopolymer transport protein ExbB|nr:MotA/TolQ/ExbB proton channel family protein [Deltaproteobacteria bacterium]MBW2499874.1 MotA/TolQ/ExbB proton channel family protein [Deltaproteobacteria bacterium]
MIEIWTSGGWVMVPLFGLAVLLYAQAFGLLMMARRVQLESSSASKWWDWVRKPANAEGRVREIIEYTQQGTKTAEEVKNRFDDVRRSLIDLLDRRTAFVGTLVAAAPLMGLLGTVFGMLQTFFGISTGGGAETAGVVASGISAALVTTQTGLTIALPGLFIVMLCRRQRQALDARLSRLESLTLSHFLLDIARVERRREDASSWPDAA